MKFTQTNIPGVLIFAPTVYKDNRGFFYESWRESTYKEAGIQENFVQDDISFSRKNVLRGLHVHRTQSQLLSVLQGRIFDAVVDIRKNSPTYLQFFSQELSAEHPQQIYMPPGTAHGFCVLSETALLHYKVSEYYEPRTEEGMLWNDPRIGIPWPVEDPILSERDKGLIYDR